MNRFWFLMLMLGVMWSLQGCETFKGAAQGFKKDVENTKYAFTKEDGWAQKTDRWIQENMW